MRIQKSDQQKTDFYTKYDHLEYHVMPFGLADALASFQGYINKSFKKQINIFIIEYFNDILTYIEDPGQSYIKAIYQILEQLQKHGLFIYLKYYQFHENKL